MTRHARGISLSGYALIVGLVSVVALSTIGEVGDSTNQIFGDVSDSIGNVITEGGGTTSPSAVFSDCSAVLQADAGAASGLYTLDGGGGEQSVYCEMDTNGGGWTEVYRAGSANMGDTNPSYGFPSAASGANEFMLAFINPGDGSLSARTIVSAISEWQSAAPMSYLAENSTTATSVEVVGGATSSNQALIFGHANWPTNSCSTALASGAFGKICFPSLTGSVFFSGFAAGPSGDFCTTSEANYFAESCSSTRLFVMFAR